MKFYSKGAHQLVKLSSEEHKSGMPLITSGDFRWRRQRGSCFRQPGAYKAFQQRRLQRSHWSGGQSLPSVLAETHENDHATSTEKAPQRSNTTTPTFIPLSCSRAQMCHVPRVTACMFDVTGFTSAVFSSNPRRTQPNRSFQ